MAIYVCTSSREVAGTTLFATGTQFCHAPLPDNLPPSTNARWPFSKKVTDALVEALRENRTLTRLEAGYSGLGEEACLRLSEVLLGSGSGIRFVAGSTFPTGSVITAVPKSRQIKPQPKS